MAFEKNVFINCPFDPDYYSLLKPLLFTIIYLGYTPRIATESLDSGTPRIAKIIKLIEESKFGIHDLSRLQAIKVGEYFRLNMPFELGIDVGCRTFKKGKYSTKKFLILGAEKHTYKAALSDLSNSDIAVHNNSATDIVREIRGWFVSEEKLGKVLGPTGIWDKFTEFMASNYDVLADQKFSPEDIEQYPVPSLISDMQEWIRINR